MKYRDRAEIVAQLNTLTYKPRWEMRFEDIGKMLHMECQAPLLDSRNHANRRYIQRFSATEVWDRFEYTGMQPLSWVATMIVRMETHEALEFLQLDGEMVLDPHQVPLDGTLDVQPANRKYWISNPLLGLAEMRQGWRT